MRAAETVGAPKCLVPLKVWLEVTVLKGHCHGCQKYVKIYLWFLELFERLMYIQILEKIQNLIFQMMIQHSYMSNRKCR